MNLYEVGKTYLARGWSVFPINPHNKKPLVKWETYQTRRPTEEELLNWSKKFPDANIGLVTGDISGIVVVDVDTYKGSQLQDVLSKGQTGLISRTARGGYHLLYKHSGTTVPNSVGADGIDVRGDGGYIVLPPSRIDLGEYKWVEEADPGKLPKHYYNREISTNTSSKSGNWISESFTHTPVGTRNDTLSRLVGYFSGKGIPDDVVSSILNVWNQNLQDSLPEQELKDSVASVLRKERSKSKTQENRVFDLVNLQQFMLQYGTQIDSWCIKDWLPDNTLLFIVAPPGTYKTWIEIDLAISIASGTPFLGQFPVERKGPVIFIQQEDPYNALAVRFATIMRSKFDFGDSGNDTDWSITSPPDLPIHFHTRRSLRFDKPETIKQLEELIAQIKPALVVIDPLYFAVDVSNYMEKAPEQMAILKDLKDKYHCTFVITHHTRKGSETTAGREELWGTQFLNAFLETGWQLREEKSIPHSVICRRHTKSHGNPSVVTLTFDVSTETDTHYSVAVSTGGPLSEPDSVLNFLNGVASASIEDIAKAIGKHRTTTVRIMQDLVDKGQVLVVVDSKAKNKKTYKAIINTPEF